MRARTCNRVAPMERRQTELGSPSKQGCLGAGVNEKESHEEADQAKRRQIQTKGAHQISGLIFSLLRSQNPSGRTQPLLKVSHDLLAVESRLETDVDLVNSATVAEKALSLGDVHYRQFAAGERADLLEINQGTNLQFRRVVCRL